jgi:hypothetical protein
MFVRVSVKLPNTELCGDRQIDGRRCAGTWQMDSYSPVRAETQSEAAPLMRFRCADIFLCGECTKTAEVQFWLLS